MKSTETNSKGIATKRKNKMDDEMEYATLVAIKESNDGDLMVDITGIDHHTTGELYQIIGVIEGIKLQILDIISELIIGTEDEDEGEESEPWM